MKPRRKFLYLAVGTAMLPAVSRIARAQVYPARPARIIVGFAPGGTSDISARLMGQWLSERLGDQFITENKTGAAGNIAVEYVANATPNGYTLLVFASPAAINATLYTNLNFNLIRDIAPVAGILRVPDVILVNPSFPAQSVPELIAYAKANPGKINMATAGIGSTPHIFGELFKMMAGVNLLPVHYRGGAPALTDLLAGQVQVMFDPVGEAIPYIKAGKLSALAVTSATRLAALPDIPTVGDFVPGYEADGYQFVLGNSGTHVWSQSLYKQPPYNTITDFAPVSLVTESPRTLITPKSFPANSLPEFIAYVKPNQTTVKYGSAGVGSASHVSCVLFNAALGINIIHVPYRGLAPAMQDLIAGRVDYLCDSPSTTLPQFEGNFVKVLTTTGLKRAATLPQVPTAREQGLPFDLTTWQAIFLPKGTPDAIVQKLNQAIGQTLDSPSVRDRFSSIGEEVTGPERRGPEYLAKFVASEIKRWSGPIQASGATMD